MAIAQKLAWMACVILATANAASQKPLKVIMMTGQSNMEGHGHVSDKDESGKFKNGTLEYLLTDPRTKAEFASVRGSDGKWVTRKDVMVTTTDQNNRSGYLTVGFGGEETSIGPELGFGMHLADLLGEPILLIKTVWGGKSLAGDYRPPSAIASRGNPQNATLVTLPNGQTSGVYFKLAVDTMRDNLGRLKEILPAEWLANGYELAAFEWHQGWNDGCDFAHQLTDPNNAAHEYENNLVDFINDMRGALKEFGAASDLPFVIGASGFAGKPSAEALNCDAEFGAGVCTGLRMIWSAQMAVGNPSKHPELKEVKSVDSVPFLREKQFSPGSQGYHWWNNAETYFLLGKAMAAATATVIGHSEPAQGILV